MVLRGLRSQLSLLFVGYGLVQVNNTMMYVHQRTVRSLSIQHVNVVIAQMRGKRDRIGAIMAQLGLKTAPKGLDKMG